MHTVLKISESMHTVPKISESMHSVQKIIWIYATCQKNNLNLCTLSKKYSESMHTVQKIIWISAGKPWACHGWSRCNGICLVSWHDICNQKLTYSPAVTGMISYAEIHIIFGTVYSSMSVIPLRPLQAWQVRLYPEIKNIFSAMRLKL